MTLGYVLVTIADQKVRVELSHIESNLTNTLRSIDTAENAELLTRGSQTLEWHAHTRLADDSVENGDFDCIASFLFVADCGLKKVHEHIVRDGICILHLHGLRWSGFAYVLDSLATRVEDLLKVDNLLAGLED